jgi:hypothetical protein
VVSLEARAVTESEWIAFFQKPEIPAFNRTMAENADAPLPRLVFADWVEENLHKPYFVAALRKSIDQPNEVVKCRGLLNFNGAIFRFQFGRLWAQIDTNHASTSRRAKQELLKAIFASGWVGHLSMRVGTPESLNRWLADPTFALLEGLDFGNQTLPVAIARQLFAGLRAPLLRRLNLSGAQLGNTGAMALARCEPLDELRELDLSYNRLQAGGAGAVIGSKSFPNLSRLTLDQNLPVGNDGVQHFLYAKHRQPLRFLSLVNTDLTAAGAGYLASSPCLSELTELRLSPSEIGPAGAEALANSRYLPEHIRAQWRAVAEGTA